MTIDILSLIIGSYLTGFIIFIFQFLYDFIICECELYKIWQPIFAAIFWPLFSLVLAYNRLTEY